MTLLAIALQSHGMVIRGLCPPLHERAADTWGVAMPRAFAGDRGFTLMEVLIVCVIIVIISAIAIPSIFLTDEIRARQALREVERELQTARLKAVTTNRAMQVRFNCPATGMYRTVEAGTVWPDEGRCSETTYPYPAPVDAAYQVPPKPRYDGPVRYLDPNIVLSPAAPNLVIEFLPDGRTGTVSNGVVQLIDTMQVDVTCRAQSKTVEINGIGRIQIQQ
jgi:prepilin-type N-terminal cleavage/methylation domain-containing protein